MKETILYISKSEKDIVSFLKYLQSKLKAEQKECTLDEKYDILKVPINTAMQKMKNLKIFLCTQERVQRE